TSGDELDQIANGDDRTPVSRLSFHRRSPTARRQDRLDSFLEILVHYSVQPPDVVARANRERWNPRIAVPLLQAPVDRPEHVFGCGNSVRLDLSAKRREVLAGARFGKSAHPVPVPYGDRNDQESHTERDPEALHEPPLAKSRLRGHERP